MLIKTPYLKAIWILFICALFVQMKGVIYAQEKPIYKGKISGQKEALEKKELYFTTQNLGSVSWQKNTENTIINQQVVEVNASFSASKNVFSHSTQEITPIYTELGTPSFSKRLPFKIPDTRTISFKYLNTLGGLPSDNVISMCEDDYGNIWVASDVGIFKISGFYIHYYDYKQNFPECSPEKIINYEGKIYIATFGQGLFVLDGSTLEIYNQDVGFYSNHLIGFDKDSTGLYINYYGNGLIHHNKDKTFTEIAFSEIESQDLVVESMNTPLGRLFVSEKGVLGLLHPSLKQYKTITSDAFSVTVKSKMAANEKDLYISIEDKGIVHYSNGIFKLIQSPSIAKINQLFLAKSGALWAFGPKGLISLRGDLITKEFSTESYFQNLQVSSIIQDKSSNLWLSSYNKGIGIISPSNFSIQELPQDAVANVKAIYLDKNKNKFVEHKNGGLLRLDSLGVYAKFANPELKNITSLTEYQNALYIATMSGLFYIQNNELFKIDIPKDKGLNTHLYLTATPKGLYINNYNYGLLLLTSNKLYKFSNFSSLTYSSHYSKNGILWVGNDTKGYSKILNDSVVHYNSETGFISNKVYCVTTDENNFVYAGTQKGLYTIRNDSLYRIPIAFQSSEKIINCNYNALTKQIWVSNGIEIVSVEVSAKNLNLNITRYNRNEIIADGVIQTNTLTHDGKNLLFGVGNKLVEYKDFKFGYQEKTIPIELIEIKTRNTSLETEYVVQNTSSSPSILTLEAGNYDLNFTVDIKHWGKEEGMLFYYRIIGWSGNWKGPITDNTIALNNLPPGNYTLEVKAESSDNVTIEPLIYKFKIEQFFYQTTWFLLLCAGILLLVVYMIFKTYSNFDFRIFESYTSLNEVLVKLRLLSIFSIILFPAMEFYVCIYLNLYPIDWVNIGLVAILCIVTLLATFSKKISYNVGYFALIFGFTIIYSLYALKAFRFGFAPSIAIEIAVIILFAKIVFTELRNFIYFGFYAVALNFILFYLLDTENITTEYFNIYLSASIQSIIIVFVMYLIDFNSKRNILFANKILESTDLFVLVCDEKGKIIFINDYLRRVTNKSDNELLGFGWWKFRKYNENQLSDTIVKINSMIKLGQSESYVNTLVLENQSLFIEWNDFVLDNQYLIGIGKDVTKEYTLNQQNERLSLVAKSVTNGVVITNAQGIIQWVNESFESLFDSKFDEVIGENITQLYCKGEVANDTFQGDFNSNSSFEFNFKSDKVASRWLLINTTPIFDEHKKVISYISIVTNISTRKKLETKLTEYADDLEINNLLKEQLIYSESFEEITAVSLSTIIQKIPSIKVGSLLLLNSGKTGFNAFYFQNDAVKKVTFSINDIKGYENLAKNQVYLEKDIRLLDDRQMSFSDKLRFEEDGIISFIELPISYNQEFIGALGLEFDTVFPLTERQINLLQNFATLLSVAIHKIQIQRDLLNKNKDITDSLFYAKSIQTSYLPHSDELKNIFKDFVLYYKPKDIVSGDFYWMEDYLDFSIIAVGDCTGHGVPGAFITMLGHNLLTQVTREMTHYSPSAMITFINNNIYNALNKNKDTYIKDGMELGICVYHKRENKITFAGAGIDLYYFQNNELQQLISPRYMVGDKLQQNEMTDQSILLNGTEKFYLSSDGYRDQLGGEPRKRYSKARYVKLLTEIKNLPSFQQAFILNLNHQNHKGNHDQTDDILVIGFEL